MNISRLVYGAGRAFQRGRPGDPLEHVCIIAAVGPDTMVSYDYGQFFHGAHGGRRVTRHSHTRTRQPPYFFATTLPGRPLIGWLNLFELLEGPLPEKRARPRGESPSTSKARAPLAHFPTSNGEPSSGRPT